MSSVGILYLVPVPVAEGALQTLAPEVITQTARLRYYFAEHIRTARRFLKSVHRDLVIDELELSEIDKHAGPDLSLLKRWLLEGKEVGVLSEAGCPGIADPGAELVAAAHAVGAGVVPLTGPSSIILALMASGLNGQTFCFNGYLPVKEPHRSQRIKELEVRSRKEAQTELFIETPYRNQALLEDFLRHCAPGTLLCIAQNLTSEQAFIKTLSVSAWQKNKPVLEKSPAVFLLLA